MACSAVFCPLLAKYFEMSEYRNNSACYFVEFWNSSDISVTFKVYHDCILKGNLKRKNPSRFRKHQTRGWLRLLQMHWPETT